MKNQENKLKKIMFMISTFGFLFMANFSVAYAGTGDYGKDGAKYFLDQIFWIGVVILVIALVGCIMRKSTVAAVTTFILGVVILYLIKNPTAFETAGSTIAGKFGL